MNKIRLIIWREFITRVRKPSFLIMTILGPVLIAGGILLTAYLGMQDDNDERVLVIDPAHVIANKLKNEAETAKIVATIAKLRETMAGDNRRLINIAMDDLGFETQAFAHRRMDQSIKKVLSGRKVDDIKMGEDE